MKAEDYDRLLQNEECDCAACQAVGLLELLGLMEGVSLETAERMHAYCTEEVVVADPSPCPNDPEGYGDCHLCAGQGDGCPKRRKSQ